MHIIVEMIKDFKMPFRARKHSKEVCALHAEKTLFVFATDVATVLQDS